MDTQELVESLRSALREAINSHGTNVATAMYLITEADKWLEEHLPE